MENSLLTLKNVTHEVVDNTLVISITKDAQFNSFIHVDGISESTSKVKIICKENSFVKLLVEKYDAKQKFEFVLEKNANVKLNFLSLEHKAAGEYTFDLAEASELHVAMADLSDANVDFTSYINLNGDNSYAEWHLASLGAGDNQKVFNINFDHYGKNTYGNMSNYGVVEDAAFTHFKGISYIHNKSVESKTHQSAKIMVFDEKCHAKANPILKIDENDIEASHAAVVGKVNDEHMFYLCSRGIKENDAKQLITLGYLKPITQYFEDENDVNRIVQGIEKRL